MKRLVVGLVLVWMGTGAVAALGKAGPPASASRAVFERRILPLMKAPNPSSCAECHLSGVDLKDYIRPTEGETYASLLKQGLVDGRNPAGSRLLRLIRMSSPKSSLVNRKAREAEYGAFKAWIEAASRNPGLSSARAVKVGPKVPDPVIRHTRADRLLESFTRTIWAQEGRCSGCHAEGSPGTARFAKTYGERMAWIVPDDPAATLQRLRARKLIDIERPERSLLLTKPIGAVEHGGGVKFGNGDRTYGIFLGWLKDYSSSVRGAYETVASLPDAPAERLVPTGSTLQIVEGPEAWIGSSLRVDLYSEAAGGWSRAPVATADRPFNRGHGSNLLVFRIGSGQGRLPPSEPLDAGRYLLKFYLAPIQKPGESVPPPSASRYLGSQVISADWKRGEDFTRVKPEPQPEP